MDWKIKSERTVNTRRFNIIEQEVELPNKDQLHFSYVDIHQGVCIFALTDQKEVLCLRQYRHAIRHWEWELPAGGIEKGEDPLETAKRELIEETGFEGRHWESLGWVYPSPGSTTEKIHLFFAKDLKKVAQQLESGEEIKLFSLPVEELHKLVQNGEFNHGAGLAAILRVLLKLEHSL